MALIEDEYSGEEYHPSGSGKLSPGYSPRHLPVPMAPGYSVDIETAGQAHVMFDTRPRSAGESVIFSTVKTP